MNRSILSLTALSAIAYTSAAPAFILNDTRRAGDNYSLGLLSIDDDSTGAAGGEAIKSDDVTLAKGANVGEDGEQTQQQAAASDTSQVGAEMLGTKKPDDVAALNTGEVKAAGSEQQQT